MAIPALPNPGWMTLGDQVQAPEMRVKSKINLADLSTLFFMVNSC
jgi:hypothetical protein